MGKLFKVKESYLKWSNIWYDFFVEEERKKRYIILLKDKFDIIKEERRNGK